MRNLNGLVAKSLRHPFQAWARRRTLCWYVLPRGGFFERPIGQDKCA